MSLRRPKWGVPVLLCAALLIGSGCARFDEAQSEPFTTKPEMGPPPSAPPPPPPPLPGKPFPKICAAEGVMQGCLESTSGLIMGPDSKSALVAERTHRCGQGDLHERGTRRSRWSFRSTRPVTAA
jgi:glucose/arabinose dehydrogenase